MVVGLILSHLRINYVRLVPCVESSNRRQALADVESLGRVPQVRPLDRDDD